MKMHTLGYNMYSYLQAVLPWIVQLYKCMTLHKILEKLLVLCMGLGVLFFSYEKV